LQMAIRRPSLVRKVVLISTSFTTDGMHDVALAMFPSITPHSHNRSPW
jgi:hypothetical protein